MDDEGIRQLGKNRWAIRVKRVSKATGRVQNRKATVIGSKLDARRRRDELRAEIASTQAKRPRIRLSEFAASWLERKAAGEMKGTTVRKYGYGLRHILVVLGEMYLDAIAPADVERYLALRAKDPKASGNTRLNELRLLRTIARDALRNGYSERYWCDGVRAPRVEGWTRENPNLLTSEQFTALIGHIPAQWRGLLMFVATTGLRFGEASALHWADVHDDEAIIRWNNDRGTLTATKTRSSMRTVPVLPEVAALWGPRAGELVFPSRYGKLHRGSPLRKILDKACRDAGVTRITTHGLRRTFNNLARKLTSSVVLKSITGHTTDEMTEHYSLVGADEKSAVSRAVASAIGVLIVSPGSGPDPTGEVN